MHSMGLLKLQFEVCRHIGCISVGCLMALSKPLCPYVGDGRINYTGQQWALLYESSDEERYLASFSYLGFTVIGGSCYVLCTRMSSRKRNSTKQKVVKDFLCQIRRPLCRWLVYVGDRADCELDKSSRM